MDTRLRKFNDNIGIRSLAFLMCVMLFTATFISSIITVNEIEKAGRSFTFNEFFGTQSYIESSDLQEEFQHQTLNLLHLIETYKSESYIKKGKLLNENEGELYNAIINLYNNGSYRYGGNKITSNQLKISYDVIQQEGKNIPVMVINTVQYPIEKEEYNRENLEEMSYGIVKNYAYEYVTNTANIENDQYIRKEFIESNKEQIAEIKSILIKDQLRKFNNLKDELNSQEGMTYFVTDGTNYYTNIKGDIFAEEEMVELNSQEDKTTAQYNVEEGIVQNNSEEKILIPDIKGIEKNPAYMIYENGKLQKIPLSTGNSISWVHNIDNSIEDELFAAYNDDLKVILIFNEEYIDTKQAVYQDTSDITHLFPLILGCAIGCMILFLYLAITTGRKDEKGKHKLYALDGIWTEVQLVGILAALGMGIGVAGFTLYEWGFFGDMAVMEISFLAIICIAITSMGLWFVLSCIRLLKSHNFIKKSLLYKLWNLLIYKWCGRIFNSIKEIYNGSSLMKKIVICTLGICVLSATIFLAPVVFLVIVVFAPKWIKKFEEIKKGVEEVKNGNLTYKISAEGNSELDRLAQSINKISEASHIAVQNELKNQRMKTELISNVSHDLKTPLTSMVTYIDLLKTEGLESENAPEYLRVLDEKTERLRHLTEDLFEAAKASSGAMPVHLEKVELISLINQGLGEMDQKIQVSGLDFILNANKDKCYVMADGQLLWRVVENLLVNVLKYALENSRVYIDVKEINITKQKIVKEIDSKNQNSIKEMDSNIQKNTNIITLEVKNISKNPLNISADELMERFKRGDESRTTEGSGLGLAIAKDLIKIQGGWFELIIDGDLFKVQVMLNKYED